MDDLFDVLRRSRVAQPWQDRREFGHELLRIGPVDPDRVELEQDLEQLVVQGAVLSLEALARRLPLLGFVLGTIGRSVLEKAFVNSVRVIEAQNSVATQPSAA